MKFEYSKRRQKHYLYLGAVWLVLGVLQFFLMKEQWWLGLGWILLALISFLSFVYRKRQYYVTINSEFVKLNWPFSKKIKIGDIKSISYFAEDYIIKSDLDELRINTNQIEEGDLETLKSKLLNISEELE
jgi:hypothetical protein